MADDTKQELAELQQMNDSYMQALSVIAMALGLKTIELPPMLNRIVDLRAENEKLKEDIRTVPDELKELRQMVEDLAKSFEPGDESN